MNKITLALFSVAILLLGGTAEAARDRSRQAPAVCVLPGEDAPVVFEGRGLAFVPGGGTEPVIVRRIVPRPCSVNTLQPENPRGMS